MTDTLKDRVRAANPSFEGMVNRKTSPPWIVFQTGLDWAKEKGLPPGAGITKACTAFWELYDERKKK